MNKFDVASRVHEVLDKHQEIFKTEYDRIYYKLETHNDEGASLTIKEHSIPFAIFEELSKYLVIQYLDVDQDGPYVKMLVRARQITNKPSTK